MALDDGVNGIFYLSLVTLLCTSISLSIRYCYKSKCIECGGGSICEHDIEKGRCKKCNFHSYLVNLQRYHLWRCLQHSNIERTKPSIEYLGCDATYFKKYIESKFIEGMSWDNIHLDHIKPIKEFNLDDNIELLKCCHYSNFQPLLEYDNKLKSNKWSKEDNALAQALRIPI